LGRCPSVSAWIADGIRAKARACAELVADLETLEQPFRGYVLLADRGHVALATSAAVVAQVWRARCRRWTWCSAIIAIDRDAVVLTSDPEDIARRGVPTTSIVPFAIGRALRRRDQPTFSR
jgi:hypothetical protein